ncbi:MAG: hypothetical protein IJ258_06250 [Methanobrevibacter sp.]|uniref:hypothetical protein n=1 Tax=Methanobrevibacter sp. TaxID=66852 RepID=UPI0025EB26B5|nr:hypothetical protein [Methanobrevibacter sp.]MBQ8017692.1 hypothetical protein [Methanobrevibacter sp.]
MDFDERRIDLVKTSIKNVNSGQKIISKVLDNKIHVHWPKEDEYLGNESIYDHLTCDDANWSYVEGEEVLVEREIAGDGQISSKNADDVETEEVKVLKIKVNTGLDENPLIDLALNHPESHVRIAAIKKLGNVQVLSSIIVNDEDKQVKKASLNRLEELYI